MKKWQEWLIVVIFGIFVLAGVGATYYYLTMDNEEPVKVEVTTTEVAGESELDEVGEELDALDDMDLSELDAIEKDLDSIDMEGL